MQDIDYQEIRQLRLFRDLLPEQWDAICPLLIRVGVIAGEELIRQGNRADHLFVLLKGHFMIHRSNGRCVTVNKKGDVLGWYSVVKPFRYTANVTALNDGIVLSIPAEKLLERIDADAELGEILLKTIKDILSDRHSMGLKA